MSYLERAYDDYLKLVAPEGPVYCCLDEAHFFPEWQVFVKAKYEQQNIKFIVTGSNSHLLTSSSLPSFPVLAMPVEVYPFSFLEFIAANGLVISDMVAETRQRNRLRKLLDDYLRFGGFPETSTVDAQATKNEILVMYARNILIPGHSPPVFNQKGGRSGKSFLLPGVEHCIAL